MARSTRLRAMTLIEVIVTLTIIITLGLFLARSFTGTNRGMSLQNAGLRLASAQVAVRDAAQANLFEVPTVLTQVEVKGNTLISGDSEDSDHISVRWLSATQYSMAVVFRGGCLVLIDDISNAEGWGVDTAAQSNCHAPTLSEVGSVTLGEIPAEAAIVDLAG